MTVERMLAVGESVGFPAVRLSRAETLEAGEPAWRRYLGALRADQQARLADALRAGPRAVGMVRG